MLNNLNTIFQAMAEKIVRLENVYTIASQTESALMASVNAPKGLQEIAAQSVNVRLTAPIAVFVKTANVSA